MMGLLRRWRPIKIIMTEGVKVGILNFYEQFAEPVEKGIKTQTIRKVRKRPIKVGETLYLYTGNRFKRTQRLLCKGKCTQVKNVLISNPFATHSIDIYLDGTRLNKEEAEAFCIADGFESMIDFAKFFHKQHRLPFFGAFIKWKLVKEPTGVVARVKKALGC